MRQPSACWKGAILIEDDLPHLKTQGRMLPKGERDLAPLAWLEVMVLDEKSRLDNHSDGGTDRCRKSEDDVHSLFLDSQGTPGNQVTHPCHPCHPCHP